MSRRTIPAREEVICDRCKQVCEPNGPARRIMEGSLRLNQHALDFQGSPVADGSRHWDLCDNCLLEVGVAIDRAMLLRSQVAR